MKFFTITAATLVALVGSAAPSHAVDHHIDDLAFDLQNQTAALVREIRYGYRHHPEFAHLYEDAIEMTRHAEYVHRIAHHQAPSAHLAREVSELDELFHHVEEIVEEADRTGHYHVNHFHQRRAFQVLALIDETLHHLLDDLSPPVPTTPAGPSFHVQPVPAQPTILNPRPVYYPNGYYPQQGYPQQGYPQQRGFSFQTGNGRILVRLAH